MQRLGLLDYGRFLAAIFVVLYHYTFNGIANGKITSITHINDVIDFSKYGYLGVELFFMISGYVIFYSAQNSSAAKFAVSRAIRLYPAYWVALILTSVVTWFWGNDLMTVSIPQVVINLTMFQSYLGYGHVDGVYWTLVYEVMFYAAVFLLLLCGMQNSLNTIFIYWPIVMAIALLLGLKNIPYLSGYYCYFAAGSLFALIKQKADWRSTVSLIVAFLLCIAFSSGKAASLTISKNVFHSEYVITFIITMFFVFFLLLNTKTSASLKLPMATTLGAMTYPVYLIHAHIGYMIISKFATEENKWLVYALTFMIVCSIAFIIHKLVEVKLSVFWKKIFSASLGMIIVKCESAIKRVNLADTKAS
jgi:peptidoglycan/LPS O-acetylase OafA/YrhL